MHAFAWPFHGSKLHWRDVVSQDIHRMGSAGIMSLKMIINSWLQYIFTRRVAEYPTAATASFVCNHSHSGDLA